LFVVRNQEVADDIFQDTFMKAIVTIQQGRYVENGKFQAWLTRIAHNLIIDFFRQTKNENCVSNDEVEYDLFNDVKLTEANVETKMVHEQVLDDVKLLIEHLPQNQKEVVFMRYYQGLSFKEIAEVTGVSINTALGRMRYALLNLRRLAVKKELHLAI
jgi:RNA polymerase sigma-70 factor (ECF subfamily)